MSPIEKEVIRTFVDAMVWRAAGNPPADAVRRRAAEPMRTWNFRQTIEAWGSAIAGRPVFVGEGGVIANVLNDASFREVLIQFANQAVEAEFNKLLLSSLQFTRPRRIERLTEEVRRFRHNELSTLASVGAGGELASTPVIKDERARSASTAGALYLIPRHALIGSRDTELLDLPREMAFRVAETINSMVWDEITSNSGAGPVMPEDGLNLFSDARETPNLLTGGTSVLSSSSFSTAAEMLRNIRNAAGAKMKTTPAFLIVPAALATTALELREKLGLGTILTGWPGSDLVQRPLRGGIYRGPLTVIVEPALDDVSEKAWYLSGPAETSGLEVVSVQQDTPAPRVDVIAPKNILGIGLRLYCDCGFLAEDWRSIIRVAGE